MSTNSPPMRAIRFLLVTLAAQLIGWWVGDVLLTLAPSISPLHLVAWVITAFLVARSADAPWPWQLTNGAMPLAIALTSSADIPAWPFLLLFIALFLIYLPTLRFGVPFYPTPRAVYEVISARLPTDKPFLFIDVGCGFGTLLSYLARRHPAGRFLGVELAPLPLFVGRLHSLLAPNRNLEIRYQSLWETSLKEADIVYAFLAPPPMAKLWRKVQAEMKPGSLFITNTFPVPAEADEQRVIIAGRGGILLFHRIR